MSIVRAKEIRFKQPGESRIYYWDFGPLLAASETLSGTPTVTGSPSGLTIGTVTVGSTALTKEDSTIAVASEWCQARISAGTDGVIYDLSITASTSASNTLQLDGTLVVED